MNNKYLCTALTALAGVLVMFLSTRLTSFRTNAEGPITVGFVYIGDASTAYTNNFYRAQTELEDALGDRVRTLAKYNIPEEGDKCERALRELAEAGCNLIFATSYSFGEATKAVAADYPDVQFCHMTGSSAQVEPVLANFHNAMGTIYQGRYISGVVAGMKLLELIESGALPRSSVRVGYVAAFPYAEVISGYTAFFLGVRSVVPEALMTVRDTNTWSSYVNEKRCAEQLIVEDGCVIISQHSDTTGPAIACEEASVKGGRTVYHVGYNQSMGDVAPTTSLVSCRINWAPYVIAASQAVLHGRRIEHVAQSRLAGNDSASGFDQGWIEIIGLNKLIAAPGTEAEVTRLEKQFKAGGLDVFKGGYIGVNPFDETDVWDLRVPYPENAIRSAPSFCYVLRDVIALPVSE